MGCCSGENDGGKSCCSNCTCLPYVDGYMIAAQTMSIVAILISWIWWVTFIIGSVSFVLLQFIWCCRQSTTGLYMSAVISTLAGTSCVIAGIFMIVMWKDRTFCSIWTLVGDDDDSYYRLHDDNWRKADYCEEDFWAVVAFVTALLWFATTGCILQFVISGRHAKLEEKFRDTDTTTITTTTPTAIEMETLQHYHHHDDDDHQQHQQQSTMETTATLTEHATADSYVLTAVPYKTDDIE